MRSRGFTLIELLVVIAIIGILSAVVLASLGSARGAARDAKRLSDLQSIQQALEMYANDNHGNYPPTGFNGTHPIWGNCVYGNKHGLTGPIGWVPFIGASQYYSSPLPIDPSQPADQSGNLCYAYESNGTDYMLMANLGVESYTSVTNRWQRQLYDGNAATCPPNDQGYQPTFAFYTPGAACW